MLPSKYRTASRSGARSADSSKRSAMLLVGSGNSFGTYSAYLSSHGLLSYTEDTRTSPSSSLLKVPCPRSLHYFLLSHPCQLGDEADRRATATGDSSRVAAGLGYEYIACGRRF